MKQIKLYSSGEEVRLWQSRIGIHIDGKFGKNTKAATEKWQAAHALKVDGIVGPATWRAAGFLPTKYNNLYCIRIPFSQINDINVLLRPRTQIYNFGTPKAMVFNAAMFDMNTGRNVTDLVVRGKLDNGGNYSNKGFYFEGNRVTESTTAESVGKSGDFIGGAPTLISHGVKSVDMAGLPQAFYTGVRERMSYGFDAEAFYIITTGQKYQAALSTVLAEGLYQKLTALINVDGGGSTAMWFNGTVFSDGRPIPTALSVQLRSTEFS